MPRKEAAFLHLNPNKVRHPTKGYVMCGAKLKSGKGLCMAPAMENGRCRIHGGATPAKHPGKPRGVQQQENARQNLRVTGFYTSALGEEERAMWEDIPARGGLERELKVARLQLYRLLKEQTAARAVLQDPEIIAALIDDLTTGQPIRPGVLQALGILNEVQTNKGTAYSVKKGDVVDVGTKKITHRVRDYHKRIMQTITRIAKLELTISKQQAMAMGGLGPGGTCASREEFVQSLAMDLRQFCANVDYITFGHCGAKGLGDEDLGPPTEHCKREVERQHAIETNRSLR